MKSNELINIAILVIGDLNRSPRMLNHAKAVSSLVKNVNQVSLIGYNGGDLREDIKNDKKIQPYYINLNALNVKLSKLPRFLFPLVALIKIIFQIYFLIWIMLFSIPKPKMIILQNPPSIPALLICILICFIRKSKLVLDWHNYGYTILKVNGRNKILVYLSYLYEKVLGGFSYINLCVSKAMKQDLKSKFNIEAIEFPDKPMPNVFSNKTPDSKDVFNLFMKYKATFKVESFFEPDLNSSSLGLSFKKNRPFLFLSSTSWSPDEDFDILLNAMVKCDGILSNSSSQLMNDKEIYMIITGKGPMRDAFIQKTESKNLKYFKVKTIWLDSDDYPKVLSMVDLGVCMHYSSSGYDLPMKVVDMFSAGLPVLAIEYETLKELVKDKKNGYLFKDDNDLCELMRKSIIEFYEKGENKSLTEMRDFIRKDFNQNWIEQWKERLYDYIVSDKNQKLN